MTIINQKKCIECLHFSTNFVSNRHRYCNNCQHVKIEKQKERCRNFKQNNKDYISQYNKNYKNNNKEKIKEYDKLYSETIRKTEDFRKKKNEYFKFKRDNDEQYKISLSYRNRLYKLIGNSRKSVDILDCSKSFLIEWFKYLDNDIIIKNHGVDFHIDHVIPCKKFDLINKNQLELCFHWSNLQPLEPSLNMSKKDKISFKDIFLFEIKLYSFLHYKNMIKNYKKLKFNRMNYLLDKISTKFILKNING